MVAVDLEAIRRAARLEVEDRMAGLAETMSEATALRDRAMAATASASSRDGVVEVSVNATGVVIGIELGADAYREYTPEELSAELVAVAQSAATAVQSQVEATLTEIRALVDPDGIGGRIATTPGFESLAEVPRPSTAPPQSDQRRFR